MTKEARITKPEKAAWSRVPSAFVFRHSFGLRHSSFSRLLPEQVGDCDFERRQQLFGQHFPSGENALQHQTILAAVIDLHIVVARIDHPEARDIQFLVNLLFHYRIRAMKKQIYEELNI